MAAGARPVEPRPLSGSFYARPSLVVARDLLGRLLVRTLPEVTLVGRIVECEAYREDDPASHSYRGVTNRTEVMFGRAGRLYVYFTYGMHYCMNVVTGKEGEGSAVLLRAVEPLEGLDWMREQRGVVDDRSLCRGPARLTQAYGVGRADNGIDLVDGTDLFVAAGRPIAEGSVGVSPRVGIRAATELPWRFFEAGSPFVSKPARLPAASGRRRGRG
jgi:DNA-3-methyladenine glycosylase